MKQYCVSDHCRLVKGILGSAIYDLRDGQVISIDADGTKVLLSALMGKEVDSVSTDFLDELEKNDWLNDHSTQIIEPHIRPRLNYVWLELTNRCNCQCLHCYGAFGMPTCKQINEELSYEEWISVINTVYEKGCRSIQFIGGEPLLFPRFIELLAYASQIGMKRIDVFTNGYLMSEEIADALQKAGASVRVSLYGYNAESHDRITQHPGSFDKLECALDMLKKRGIPISIAIVLMRENQKDLPKIKQYLEMNGLKYQGFDTVRTVKHSPQASHAVTDTELIEKRMICTPRFKTSAYHFSVNHQWNSCWYGKLSITAKGDIIPCIFARDLICGNVRTDDWNAIRDKLLHYWRITKDEIDECKGCEYRYACDDCRPLAMGDGDGIYAKYPRCCYKPSECNWR